METEFAIDSVQKAAWAMRKYRVLAQQRAKYVALAEAEHARIDAWLERMSSATDARMEFFEAHLQAYAMKERIAGRKSIELPDGVIKSRQTTPTFEVDKAVFLEWVQEAKRDDLVRVTLAPDMTAIKGTMVADGESVVDPLSGEVVPGLTPVRERVTVSIAPDLDAIDLEGIEGVDDEFE